jgi:hypothetical protein
MVLEPNGIPGTPEYPESIAAQPDRPILAVDVDGVISLFGFESIEAAPGRFELLDGVPHCISPFAGERLNRLAQHYELVWATGWEERANYHLPRILGLPEELPCLTFDGRAAFGSAHWKLEAITEFSGSRPLAWIDDNIDASCVDWARDREAPTLLVPTESERGIEEAHVETLVRWVEDGFEPR